MNYQLTKDQKTGLIRLIKDIINLNKDMPKDDYYKGIMDGLKCAITIIKNQ